MKNNFNPGFLKDAKMPSLMGGIKVIGVVSVELMLGMVYYLTYSEALSFGGGYLSTIPLLGRLFESVAPDANISTLVCLILAIASISIPLMIANEVIQRQIFKNAQAYFSEISNRITAGVVIFLLVGIIAIECFSLYTVLANSVAPDQTIFIEAQAPSGFMAWMAENPAYPILVSLALAILNMAMSFVTCHVLNSVNKEQR